MKRLKVLFLCIAFFFACSIKQNEIDLIAIDITSEKGVDEYFESYYSISLETNEECLISNNIDKVIISDNKLYILDKRRSSIYIFDEKGFYLNKIDKKGAGPTEYSDIADIVVSDSLIYILSRASRKILVYSKNIEYIKHYPLNDFYDYFYFVDEDIFLYSNYSNDTRYNIAVYNLSKRSILHKFFPFETNQSFSFFPSPFNKTFDENLFFTQQYDYNIYKLNISSIDTIFRLGFNTSDKIPGNYQEIGFDKTYQDLSNKSVVKRIEFVNQTDKYLYIVYDLDYVKSISKIEKSTKVNSSLKLKYNDKFPFVFAKALGFYKDYMIGYLQASEVLVFDNKFPSDKRKEGLLDEDDNPVLFFHKLKSDE
jgi:hypothetical protein